MNFSIRKLFDKKNQNAASYTGNQLTTERLDFYIAPGFAVTISHFLSIPFLCYHFIFSRSDHLYHRGEVVTPYG